VKVSKFAIIDHIGTTVAQQQKFLKEQNERMESMYDDYNDLLEYKQVIEASHELLQNEEYREIRERIESQSELNQSRDHDENLRLLDPHNQSEIESEVHDDDDGVKIGRVVGTCLNDDLLRLKRILFRSTRGNALVLTKNTGGIETFDK